MNRNRMNKKRMGRARVLSRAAAGMLAAALCFQPMTALAGPAGDSSLTSSSSNAGPGGGSGQLQSGKYRQLWRFDFSFQWKCERGHIRAWRVPGDGE
ncbi:MAG: hypothetical protein ACLT76_01430 [Clostridium fessum]